MRVTSKKSGLRTKIVVIYEAIFNGEDPSIGSGSFWNEVRRRAL